MEFNDTATRQNFTCVLPNDITEAEWSFFDNFSWWLEGFGSIFIGSIGIVLNLISIFVLCGSELAASFFNWLLVCLALFDILFLFNGILEGIRRYFGSTAFHRHIFLKFLFPFRSIVMCCSIYMTVILALERYNAFKRPLSYRKNSLRGSPTLKTYFLSNWKRVIKYVGPIIIFATFFYVPKWFELRFGEKNCAINTTDDNYSSQSVVEFTELRNNNQYSLWYLNVANPLVTALVPLIALAYLNVSIYLEFKKYMRRQPSFAGLATAVGIADLNIQRRIRKREKELVQQTTVLFAIVVLFVIFHVLRIILNIEELDSLYHVRRAKDMGCEWLQFWTLIAVPISDSLLQINSSINFFIYCVFNKSFRDALRSKLSGLVLASTNPETTTLQKHNTARTKETNHVTDTNRNKDVGEIIEMNMNATMEQQ